MIETGKTQLEWLTDVTGLGDSVVLLSLALALAVYLIAIGYRREPLAVLLGFFLPALTIGLLKVSFYVCKANLWGIVSPSGHTAISFGVLGLSALILSKISTGIWRAILPLILVGLAITIATSRTILGMHTDGDVVAGGLIGIVYVLVIAKIVLSYRLSGGEGSAPKRRAHPLILIALIFGVVGLTYGIKLPSEQVMASMARQIKEYYELCQ